MGALGDWYHQHIIEPGKQPLFLLLVSFVVTFLFTRFSVRMIRKGVKWWPGTVSAGDTHVHHVIFGITCMLIAGLGAFTPAGGNEPWWDVLAVLFGVGAALVLDEFALVLHLKDVYWAEQGRQSVNAVVIAAAVTTMLILGALPLGVDGMTIGENTGLWSYVGTLALNFIVVLIALLKGRLWLGILGLLVPLLAVIAALRVARPKSPYARWFYKPDSRRARKSQARMEKHQRRFVDRKNRLFDLVAGRPSQADPDT